MTNVSIAQFPPRQTRPYKMTPEQMLCWVFQQTVTVDTLLPNSPCHEWTGSSNNAGYGAVGWRNSMRLVHRLVYALTHGVEYEDIPRKTAILHKCGNRACVRLSHLEAGTQQYNDKAALAANLRRIADGTHNLLGSNHPRSKLTEDDIPVIRARLAKRDRQVSIAADFGVSTSSISNIKTGRTWRHIGDAQ